VTDKPLTLEQKWDQLWPAACAVIASIEALGNAGSENAAEQRLLENCRRLKRVCDHISPDSPE